MLYLSNTELGILMDMDTPLITDQIKTALDDMIKQRQKVLEMDSE